MKKKEKEGGQVKASLTVEASLIVPIILFTIVYGINISYQLFKDVKSSTVVCENIEELDLIKIVRDKALISDILYGTSY